MNKKINPKFIALTFGVLVLLFTTGYYLIMAWSEPTATPPGANVPAPINVGTTTQHKAGEIGATLFRDRDNTAWFVDPAGNSMFQGNVGIGTNNPVVRLEIGGPAGTAIQRITTIPVGTTGSYTLNWDAFQVCQFGTCCPPWRDCDGDGRTFQARTDCDEGCATCFVGSNAATFHANGRDENCNGIVDESVTVNLTMRNSASGSSCDFACAHNNMGCIGIGTAGGGEGTFRDSGCWWSVGNCTTIMNNVGITCDGVWARWTDCRCIGRFL